MEDIEISNITNKAELDDVLQKLVNEYVKSLEEPESTNTYQERQVDLLNDKIDDMLSKGIVVKSQVDIEKTVLTMIKKGYAPAKTVIKLHKLIKLHDKVFP
jgi:vacuolar-type H+-ATPase subunit E/Vma4